MYATVEPGVGLAVLCVVMVALAAAWYRVARLGPAAVAPRAAIRGAAQLGIVALVLAAALAQLWSAVLVLAVMFAAAVATAAQRSCAGWSGMWLVVALGTGIGAVLPLMLISGVVPFSGVALVPIGGIVLGGTMNATSLAARRALDAVEQRWGEVEAAMSLASPNARHASRSFARAPGMRCCRVSIRPAQSDWSLCPALSSVYCWPAARPSRPPQYRCWCSPA